MSIDVETGLDEFFKAQGSTEAQRADAIAVLKNQCSMVSGVVILTATGDALDTDNSKKWIFEHKPHLLPPKFERSLADRAFIDGNMTARGELVKQLGKKEADKIAEQYGLRSSLDSARGEPPLKERGGPADSGKSNGKGANHANNPFHKSNWNLSKQGALLRAIGPEKCAAIAASVGSRIGATRPNPDF
jgi:hypothetical protein